MEIKYKLRQDLLENKKDSLEKSRFRDNSVNVFDAGGAIMWAWALSDLSFNKKIFDNLPGVYKDHFEPI